MATDKTLLLSPYEKRVLEFYIRFRDGKPTVAALWLFNVKIYLWTAVIFIVVGFVYYFVAGPWGAGIIAAALFGTLLRDFGTFRKFISSWPMLNQIIDWDKATALRTSEGKEPGKHKNIE